MLQVNNKYLIIRKYDEVFLNISIIKNKLKYFFAKNTDIFDDFIELCFYYINKNEDKRKQIDFIININGKKKAYGGIKTILESRNINEIFENFYFENKKVKEFLQSKTMDDNFKDRVEEISDMIKNIEIQGKLITMLIYAHQALIGNVISKYKKEDHYNMLSYEELFQSGVHGLYISIFKYDYGRKNRFSTMSFYWIRYRVSEKIKESMKPENEGNFDTIEYLRNLENTKEQEDFFTKLEADNLKSKIENILCVEDLEYFYSIINDTNDLEKILKKKNKFTKLLTIVKEELNIKN